MHRRHHRVLMAVLGAALLLPAAAPAVLGVDDTTVDVADPTIEYPRFYPRKDGYRDTVAIAGSTNEPATVTIRIYTSAGTRVKSFLLGSVEGAYGVTWNGRKKDGSLFPQGTYRVQSQFKDSVGNTLNVDRSVVLSHKKVTWYLGSQTRYADTGAFFTDGDGSVRQRTTPAHAVSLTGGYVDGGYAMGRYTFTLPSAHVYASIRVSIYGTGNTDGDGHETHNAGFAGIRNFETGEVEWIREVGFEWAWYSNSVPGEDHVTSDRKAQAWALAGEGGILHYTKMTLTYKYGILGY